MELPDGAVQAAKQTTHHHRTPTLQTLPCSSWSTADSQQAVAVVGVVAAVVVVVIEVVVVVVEAVVMMAVGVAMVVVAVSMAKDHVFVHLSCFAEGKMYV